MKQLLAQFALSFIFIPLLVSSADACTCLPISTPYKAYQEARAVFAGKVVSSTDVPLTERVRDKTFTYVERRYRVAVTEWFKGAKTAEVEVSAGRTDSSCYVGFEVGETYLVYAYGDSDAALHSEMCTRTNSLAWAQDDVTFLRAMLKGVLEPRVYGSVMRVDSDPEKSQSSFTTPLAGVKIIVEGVMG